MQTDHKLLVAIFQKRCIKFITGTTKNITMHQDSTRVLYKTRPYLFIVHWLSRHNHKINRNKEIPGMNITNIFTINSKHHLAL